MSREAETYELVLALSAFTRRPRSPLDTIAISIVLPSPPPLPSRSAVPGAYLRIHAEHVTHTLAHTNSKARYTSDTGDYRVITRRFDYGLPPRIRRLSAAALEGLHPRLDETVASHRVGAPRRVHRRVRLRGGHTCVCVSRPISTSAVGIQGRV